MIKHLIQEYEEGLAQLTERYQLGKDKSVFKHQMDNYKVFINSLKKLENDYKIIINEHESEIKTLKNKIEEMTKTGDLDNNEKLEKITAITKKLKTKIQKYDLILNIIQGLSSE